ncbi:MAG: DNA polymerase III subunit delta [Gammaproteobacteria bacterium]|nr:DNA polymerase III subunit delta [Gammaproteobacteria bacterium]
MQVSLDQLDSFASKELPPIFFIHGEDALLLTEAGDTIRAAAREQGYLTRDVLDVDASFDWNSLMAEANSMSLFAERKIIELRMPGGKPGRAGGDALRAYAERPVEDTLLLIISGKLDSKVKNTRWMKALNAVAAVVPVWSLQGNQLLEWLRRRMFDRGLKPTPQAVQVLAEQGEGNLLACNQEIEKLLLLYGPVELDVDEVIASVSDSARFNVFDLVDYALGGDAARCIRVLTGLRAEGVAAPVVLWALAREIRVLLDANSGLNLEAAMRQHNLWCPAQHKVLLAKAVSRHPALRWRNMLVHCARIDQVIKGRAVGREWDELVQLCLSFSVRPLFGKNAFA